MHNQSRFTPSELKVFLRSARLVYRQPELDIRSKKRNETTSRLPGRLVVITPRRIGTAPQRNLLRRRLKALFYEEKLYEAGYDIAIYCRKNSIDLSFQELKSILLLTFSQLTTSRIKNGALY